MGNTSSSSPSSRPSQRGSDVASTSSDNLSAIGGPKYKRVIMRDVQHGLSRQPKHEVGPTKASEFRKRGVRRYSDYSRRRQQRQEQKGSITQQWEHFRDKNRDDGDDRHAPSKQQQRQSEQPQQPTWYSAGHGESTAQNDTNKDVVRNDQPHNDASGSDDPDWARAEYNTGDDASAGYHHSSTSSSSWKSCLCCF